MEIDPNFEAEFAELCKDLQAKLDSSSTATSKLRKRKTMSSNAHCHLIINYMPPPMDEIHLQKLFSKFGELQKVHLMRNLSKRASENDLGVSLGYGFVDFMQPEDGERAVQYLNGVKLYNKTLKVSYSKPSDNAKANIYVQGLPKTLTKVELDELFSAFGTIQSSVIIQNKENDHNIAFVRFSKNDEAKKAIAATNNSVLKGFKNATIQVRISNSTNKSDAKRAKLKQIIGSQANEKLYDIYVFNLQPFADDKSLWKLFGPFGCIRNAKVVIDDRTKKCIGYGFVTMKNFEEAKAAIKTLDGYTHEGRTLQVSLKDKSFEELQKQGYDVKDIAGAHTLYVYNINPKTDDTIFWKIFGHFGAVKNVKIIRDRDSRLPLTFGFVTMKNWDEASNAIENLDGIKLDNHVLQVSFKTSKK